MIRVLDPSVREEWVGWSRGPSSDVYSMSFEVLRLAGKTQRSVNLRLAV